MAELGRTASLHFDPSILFNPYLIRKSQPVTEDIRGPAGVLITLLCKQEVNLGHTLQDFFLKIIKQYLHRPLPNCS